MSSSFAPSAPLYDSIKRRREESREPRDEILARLDHPNIVLIFIQDGPASFDLHHVLTLEVMYRDPDSAQRYANLNKIDVLLQSAKGISYIHSEGIVHGNLTPACMKLFNGNTVKISDFEFGQPIEEDGTVVLEKYGAECFMPPETLNLIYEMEQNPNAQPTTKLTKKIDIFAAGCSFFYVLTDGCHPFGISMLTIPHNAMNGNQINKKRLPEDHPAWGMIQCMLRKKPSDRVDFDSGITNWLEFVRDCEINGKTADWRETWFTTCLPDELKMTCDATKRLGTTNRRMGGQVFEGTWLWHGAAVKRVFKSELAEGRTHVHTSVLKEIKHDNVLKLYHFKVDEDFLYVSMERCAASLREIFRGDVKMEVPSKAEGFRQMASGLSYIHSKGLVHGAIRPSNVLISHTIQLKLSDFGILRPDSITKSNSNGDGKFSKEFFFAPEILRNFDSSAKGEKSCSPDAMSDVFSLGCVFYSYATGGDHPFLEKDKSIFFISPNILAGRLYFDGPCDSQDRQLIEPMIQERPSRITLDQVVNKLERYYSA